MKPNNIYPTTQPMDEENEEIKEIKEIEEVIEEEENFETSENFSNFSKFENFKNFKNEMKNEEIEEEQNFEQKIEIKIEEETNELNEIKENRKDPRNHNWFYHDPNIINKILQMEKYSNKYKPAQLGIISRKLNNSMIYYLLTKCENYNFELDDTKNNLFLYVKTIRKNETIVYDCETCIKQETSSKKLARISYFKREKQMRKMAQLLKEECGFRIEFENSMELFELVSFQERNGMDVDLIEFFEMYDKQNEIKMLFTNSLEKEFDVILRSEKMENAQRRNQSSILNKKVSCAMIHYLLTECEGYDIDIVQYHKRYSMYIITISKNKEIVYDVKNFEDVLKTYSYNQNKNYRKKQQILTMTKLIEKESGMKFIFSDKGSNFDLVGFEDKNGNNLSLITFLKNHEKYDEVNDMISNNPFTTYTSVKNKMKDVQTKDNEKMEIENAMDSINAMLNENQMEEFEIDENENAESETEEIYEYDVIEAQKCTKKEMKFKWLYPNQKTIHQILLKGKVLNKSKQQQISYILKKINIAMMYWILTECKGYHFIIDSHYQNSILYINSIRKENIVIYDTKNITNEMGDVKLKRLAVFRRDKQLKQLAQIIMDEKAIEFNFRNSMELMELVSIKNNNGKYIDLMKFLDRYDKEEELMNILSENNVKTEIQQILFEENVHDADKRVKINLMNRKINCAMIYYLLTKCKGYYVELDENIKRKESLFIDKIVKNKEIVYDVENIQETLSNSSQSQQYLIRRKDQITEMAKLIKNEHGLEFEFNGKTKFFEIINFQDKNGNKMSLKNFLRTNDHSDKVFEIILHKQTQKHAVEISEMSETEENDSSTEDEMNENETKTKFLFNDQQAIMKILKNEDILHKKKTAQNGFILKKINHAMIYFLLSECNGYSFTKEKHPTNSFLYIETIRKDNNIIYDAENHDQLSNNSERRINYFKRENQMKEMAELIKKEKGIHIEFYGSKQTFELLSVKNNKGKDINLIEWFDKYIKDDDLMIMVSGNNAKNEMPKLIRQYNLQNMLKDEQCRYINRRINCAMIHYLLTNFKSYTIEIDQRSNRKDTLFLNKIFKDGELVYDVENIREKLEVVSHSQVQCIRRKEQILVLAKLIQNEKDGIIFEFNNLIQHFELLKLVDKKGKNISISEFLNDHDYYEDIYKIISIDENEENIEINSEEKSEIDEIEDEEENDDEIKMEEFSDEEETKSKEIKRKSKWLYQDEETTNSLLQFMKLENKPKVIQQKKLLQEINVAMIYYLLTQHDEYSINVEEFEREKKSFIYINYIDINEKTVYYCETDVSGSFKNKHYNTTEYLQQKCQIEKMSQLIEQESGMKFEFDTTDYPFELVNFVNKKKKKLNLINFLKKYDKYEDLFDMFYPSEDEIDEIEEIDEEDDNDEMNNENEQFSKEYLKKRFDNTENDNE